MSVPECLIATNAANKLSLNIIWGVQFNKGIQRNTLSFCSVTTSKSCRCRYLLAMKLNCATVWYNAPSMCFLAYYSGSNREKVRLVRVQKGRKFGALWNILSGACASMNGRLEKRKVKNIRACEIFGDPAKFSEGADKFWACDKFYAHASAISHAQLWNCPCDLKGGKKLGSIFCSQSKTKHILLHIIEFEITPSNNSFHLYDYVIT